MDLEYRNFIEKKSQLTRGKGFDPVWMPDFLFDFQKYLLEWSLQRGRSAIFADCGLGKTPIQLAWAKNVCKKTKGRVLILTPLAVSIQTQREGEKFGIPVTISREGEAHPVTVTNYERVHYFNPYDFAGVVLDESSAIKHFTGRRQKDITRFMRKTKYRLLCTATPSPNDHIELGTSSEALGHLGHMDMLGMFFKSQDGALHRTWALNQKWKFKAHAERYFWRWVVSWARACRKPSDLGFKDKGFKLPELNVDVTTIDTAYRRPGTLLPVPASTLSEEREELKMSLGERCDIVAEKVNNTGKPAVVWCYLNDEGDRLEKIIPDAEQISGKDSEETKEKKLIGFSNGDIRVLITKPKIGGFGLNWQHCDHMTFFPSHSFEQYYQSVRRCWRFGQKKPVKVDMIVTKGERNILQNLERKSKAADNMFDSLVREMANEITKLPLSEFGEKERMPEWL